MVIYNFHIFNSTGKCLFSLNPPEQPDSERLLYGFLYSLKSFTQRISPVLNRDNNYLYYSNTTYQLIFYELPTSTKFVLILSNDIKKDGDYFRNILNNFFQKVYVDFVTKNPIIHNDTIDSNLFRKNFHLYFSTLNI